MPGIHRFLPLRLVILFLCGLILACPPAYNHGAGDGAYGGAFAGIAPIAVRILLFIPILLSINL